MIPWSQLVVDENQTKQYMQMQRVLPGCSLFRSFTFLFVRPRFACPRQAKAISIHVQQLACVRTRLDAKRRPFVRLQRQSGSVRFLGAEKQAESRAPRLSSSFHSEQQDTALYMA